MDCRRLLHRACPRPNQDDYVAAHVQARDPVGHDSIDRRVNGRGREAELRQAPVRARVQ
jgi:hypothetical protein